MRSLSSADYGRIFFLGFAVFGAEVVGSFGFFFAPGWANGWPAGLSIYQVWSTWLTLVLFVMLITIGVALGSLVSLCCSLLPRGRRHAGNLLVSWMVIWAILTAVICAWAFREIYAATLEMWPNGYPG
jgi:hypothetical protein